MAALLSVALVPHLLSNQVPINVIQDVAPAHGPHEGLPPLLMAAFLLSSALSLCSQLLCLFLFIYLRPLVCCLQALLCGQILSDQLHQLLLLLLIPSAPLEVRVMAMAHLSPSISARRGQTVQMVCDGDPVLRALFGNVGPEHLILVFGEWHIPLDGAQHPSYKTEERVLRPVREELLSCPYNCHPQVRGAPRAILREGVDYLLPGLVVFSLIFYYSLPHIVLLLLAEWPSLHVQPFVIFTPRELLHAHTTEGAPPVLLTPGSPNRGPLNCTIILIIWGIAPHAGQDEAGIFVVNSL
mmetsp:Transcript_10838/g.29768  ORF Transcript_10838/g.29768 Transcript_10838/m.29768 type:complete len:297 (+) Transcript_10838:327-1217(+)